MKEKNIDCMKYRKSTHLAGIDVETMIAEIGMCELTIKEAYYSKSEFVNGKKVGVEVCGKILDGYFIEFVEDVKPMMVNSTNRKQIALIYKNLNKCTPAESRNIGNWAGLKIELEFDDSVKMKGQVTGGIRVKYKLPINEAKDEKALSLLSNCKSLYDLKDVWLNLSKDEQKLATVLAKKEKLKEELK